MKDSWEKKLGQFCAVPDRASLNSLSEWDVRMLAEFVREEVEIALSALRNTIQERDDENASLRAAVDLACSGAIASHAEAVSLKDRAERAEAQVEQLTQEKADFHMAYRMECDKETKALHAEIAQLRQSRGEQS